MQSRPPSSWIAAAAALLFTTISAVAWADEAPPAEQVKADADPEVVHYQKMVLPEQATLDEEPSGEMLELEDHEYELRDPDFSWRWALGGQAFALGIGLTWYIVDDETQAVDWDFEGIFSSDPDLELRSQRESWRNLERVRFDDNMMALNTPLHPLAGAGYYINARTSGLGVAHSLLAANITSLLWELGIEHMEITSINDLVYTGMGGFPMGEMYHQLGKYFRSAERTRFTRAMSWVFGLPLQLRDRIHGTTPYYDGAVGEHGFPSRTWARFVIKSNVGTQLNAARYGEIGVAMDIRNLPDYRRAGSRDRWLRGPLMNSFHVELGHNGDNVPSWGMDGRLDLLAYYRHEVEGTEGYLQGTSFYAGLGVGFRHKENRYPGGPTTDGEFWGRYGLVHLPGARLDGSLFTEAADFHLSLSSYPTMSSVDSVAYPVYLEETGREASRTVLANEGYYYGFGLSSLLRLEIDIAPMHLHGDLAFHWTRSINARDRFGSDPERFGEDLDDYLTLIERIADLEVGALFDTPIKHLRVGAVGQMRRQDGYLREDLREWNVDRHDLRMMGTMRLIY